MAVGRRNKGTVKNGGGALIDMIIKQDAKLLLIHQINNLYHFAGGIRNLLLWYITRFDKHVSMLSNSKVLGDCHIGNHVIFSANSYVIDTDIPPYSIVFGAGPDITIKPITPQEFNELTSSMFDGGDD